MNVFIVLYYDHEYRETEVLDVYTDEADAEARMNYELQLIESVTRPGEDLIDNCWYIDREVINEAGE